MKDYENLYIGQRTARHNGEDFENTLCKRDIDNYFVSMCDEIEDSKPVLLDEPEEIQKSDPVESAFKLGFQQAKREIMEIIDNYEIRILEFADKYAE